jgi:hypothetical protein
MRFRTLLLFPMLNRAMSGAPVGSAMPVAWKTTAWFAVPGGGATR